MKKKPHGKNEAGKPKSVKRPTAGSAGATMEKTKTKKAKATRGKSAALPPREYFYGSHKMPRHASVTPFFTLAESDRPKITTTRLAALVGALNLPKTRDGASEALKLAWECALVLKEQRDDLAEAGQVKAADNKKQEEFVTLIGFDPAKEKPSITHKRFLTLMNRKCRDGITIQGKKLRGADLFRAFLFDWLPRIKRIAKVSEAEVDEKLRFHQCEGWQQPDYVSLIAREFAYWRDERVRLNMTRTKGYLKKGADKSQQRVREPRS
jgi:hypothetical protein